MWCSDLIPWPKETIQNGTLFSLKNSLQSPRPWLFKNPLCDTGNNISLGLGGVYQNSGQYYLSMLK
jgi:hypothetical protein